MPGVTGCPVPVRKPPAPPPPPVGEPPPPPPATTKYSTSVTPVGQTQAPVFAKDATTLPVPEPRKVRPTGN